MSERKILIYGVICWSIAGIDALVHLLLGDLLVPAVMAVVFVAWMALRSHVITRRRAAAVAVPVTVEATQA